MSRQNAFHNKQIKDTALLETGGLLDQLNLPLGMVKFIRKNKKSLWIITIAVVFIIVAVSLYGTYTKYKLQKAATALTMALQADDSRKEDLLKEVSEKYASTPPALWSKIELAHFKFRQGKVDETIAILEDVDSKLSADDFLKPLLLNNLAILYENRGVLDKAVALYKQLATNRSFKAAAAEAMGRIYAKQGKIESALEKYRLYLALTGEGNALSRGNSQVRARVEAAVNRLQR